jgi:hypothetical protein
VDRGVIATANELFEARHYPGVVAMCSDALDGEPECIPLLVIRARARMALRRDLDAQADLRDVIRLDPRCGLAYRLLGELAARQDENASAAVFFREALRLDPDDHEAHDWLMIVAATPRPAAVAIQLPAPAAAAGRHALPVAAAPIAPATALGSSSIVPGAGAGAVPASSSRASRGAMTTPVELPRRPSLAAQARLARGTQPPNHIDPRTDPRTDPGDDRPTQPFGRQPDPRVRAESPSLVSAPALSPSSARPRPTPIPAPLPPPPAPPGLERPTLSGRPPTQPPAKPAPRLARNASPELPGFGEYLVSNGILTRERLRAAQAYQRSMKVQLSTAIVTLGLASPQRIEWAAVAHQSSLSRAP